MKIGKVIRNVVMVVLFGLLIIVFAVTGITNDALRPVPKDAVVSAGGREVSSAEFAARFDSVRENAAAEMGRPVSADEAASQGVIEGILGSMLSQEVARVALDRLGIKISPKLVADQLGQVPEFRDPMTGRFDQQVYAEKIGKLGMDMRRIEDVMAGAAATQHTFASLQAGIKPPISLIALVKAVELQSRDASSIFITPAMVGAIPEPTDAQLMTLMNENAANFKTPEARELSFVRLSAGKYLAEAKADPAEVQKLVDFRKAQTGTPETRTVIQIPAKDQATAQSVSARLAKGEDPAAIAKSIGVSVITHQAKAKADMPDRKIAEAAFALPVNKASGPVQGDLGLAVIKVTAITAGSAGAVDALRSQAEADLKKRAADAKVSEIVDKLEESLGTGADLETAAKAVGLTVVRTAPVLKDGRPLKGQPIPGLSRKLLDAAFALAEKGVSEFETEQAGEYFIVRTEKIIPPAMPPLQEVRPVLAQGWKAREMNRRLAAKGDEVAARLRKGEAIDAVAASVGATVSKIDDLNLTTGQAMAPIHGAELLTAILRGKKGDIVIAGGVQPGIAIARIDSITAADPAAIARASAGERARYQKPLEEGLIQSFQNASKTLANGKTYPDRARAAANVTTPAPAEKGKEKKG